MDENTAAEDDANEKRDYARHRQSCRRQRCSVWILNDRDDHGNVIAPDFPEHMPTAFVCNCDVAAQKLIEKLHQHGYRVPEDISVVGFDEYPPTPSSLPEISTFRTDYETMLRSTVQLMIDRYTGRSVLPSRLVVGGHPHYKQSDSEVPSPQ